MCYFLSSKEKSFAKNTSMVVNSHRRSLIFCIVNLSMLPRSRVVMAQRMAYVTISDRTHAYEFTYPAFTSEGMPVELVFSRRPEKYSSAAPLSTDAQQRIVCELVDLSGAIALSIFVGPTSGIRELPNDWIREDSTGVVSIKTSNVTIPSGQRVTLKNIKKTESKGQIYWHYEHTSQRSPTTIQPRAKETFRHGLSVSTTRSGMHRNTSYIYTLGITSPERQWDAVMGVANDIVNSFRLVRLNNNFISPEELPWMFV